MKKKPLSTITADLSEREKQAVDRVRRAGVKAPESAILAWIRSIGADAILAGSLRDIRAVADCF